MDWIDMLILFFCCILEVFLIYDYFCNFFEIKISRKYVKICLAGAVCVSYAINIQQNSMLNLLCMPLILFILVTVLFDVRWETRIVYFIIACTIMTGSEFLYIVLTNTTAKLLSETGLIPVSEYFWQLLLVKFINYILFIILKQISPKSKGRMTSGLFFSYVCIPILTLMMMTVVFYSGIDIGESMVIKILMSMLFICMIVGNVVLFYAFQKYTDNLNENVRQQMEIVYQKSEIERLSVLAEWNDNYNEVIHDTTHYLKVIGQLAYENNNDEILKVVEKLNGTLNRENVTEYSNHNMLNVILSDYAQKAEDKGIKFDAYVEPGCALQQIPDDDMITMVSNLMDNAILAASKVEKDSTVLVRIFMQNDGRVCVIKVVNDFSEKLKEENGRLVSTKKDAGLHGLGLSSVARIAGRCNGYFEHYIENGKFHAILVFNI